MSEGKFLDRARNTNDEANLSGAITVGGESVKLADANPERIFLSVCLKLGSTEQEIFIKLQSADTDNDAKGICLFRKPGAGGDSRTFWEMPSDNTYTGEISAISVDGEVEIFVTEY